jgi:hypothetical protein
MPVIIAAVIAVVLYKAHQAIFNTEKTGKQRNFLVYLYALFLRLHQ